MKALLHLWARLKRLKWIEIRRLVIFSSTFFLLSAALSLLDISVSALLLQSEGIVWLGADYLLAAFLWILAAWGACAVKKHRGYGAWRIAFAWIVLLFAIWEVRHWSPELAWHFMFAAKYGTLFLLNFIFLNLISRCIKLSMTSLKFIGICTFELLGVMFGSMLSWYVSAQNACMTALCGLTLSTCFFYGIGRLLSIKHEAFIQKTGGVQDVEDKGIIYVIGALSFGWMMARLLVEFLTYSYIFQENLPLMPTLGQLQFSFAFGSLLIFACFARTRFLYTMPLGLIMCAAAVGLIALGGAFHEAWMIFSGVVVFFISSYFYFDRYLSLLLRPFIPGKGFSIEKWRFLLVTPCAFILVGSLLLRVEQPVLSWVLLSDMGLLAFFFIVSGHLYGRQLMKMCALKMWREGPFLLAYPPLKQMLQQGLSKTSAAEAIYFLSIIDEGYIANYRSFLDQMLKHPAISVRLFVLKKLNKFSLTLKEKHLLSAMMKEDSCPEVKNMALSCLIRDALETNGSEAWHKYKEYFEDKKWVLGASCGFLYGRGVWMEKIIDTVLKLANSSVESSNLLALSIMMQHPKMEWVEAVDRLLYSTHPTVVKSAITVAGRLAAPVLLSRLLPMLDDVRWRDSVLETLNQYGKQAFPSIEKAIVGETVPVARQKILILFLGCLSSGEGKQILLRVFFQANRILRQVIIESLNDSGILWVFQDKKHILKKVIYQTVWEWHEIYGILGHLENLGRTSLLKIKDLFREALGEELQRTRRLLLAQISLYSLDVLAQRAISTLKENDLNAYAAAAGCLQDILPKKLYREVKDILLYPTQKNPPGKVKKMDEQSFLNYFLLTPPSWVNAWMKALALSGWRELNEKAGLNAVQEGLKATDWIVLEAAIAALGRLEKDRKKAANLVLCIPTRYLLKQNFEDLLEDKHVDYN